MKSSIVKRSVVIAGHKTSVRLEDAFWSDLQKIAQVTRQHALTWLHLIAEINRTPLQQSIKI